MARLIEFVLRPEAMTAYATFATALAASLSLKAARRQEMATFTSALYSKQVDALASFETKFQRFLELSSVNQSDTQQDISASDHEKIESSVNEMLQALVTLRIVYPREVHSLLDAMIEIAKDRVRNVMLNYHGSSYVAHRTTTLLKAGRALNVLETCSTSQLREGENIDGQRFQLCFAERPPV